eukprot:2319433-Pyramimonas_sp.AAC.1
MCATPSVPSVFPSSCARLDLLRCVPRLPHRCLDPSCRRPKSDAREVRHACHVRCASQVRQGAP